MPFEELPHTADWCLHVWADELPSLFVEAARGMNAIAGMQPAAGQAISRTLNLTAPDAEELLVAFLSELIYTAEQERLVFDNFEIQVEGQRLNVEMSGAPLASINKTIKAVTYHNLKIRGTQRGLEVEIVFDV